MENLIFSLNATIPIFLMMLLGMLFRKLGWMDEVFAVKMNKFVFLVPLPVLLFEQLATVDFSEVWDIKFILFCFVVTAISITISTLISLLWKDRSIKGEFIQATYRSSAALLGFRNEEMIAILVMLGSATTVSCFVMARNMGHGGTLSSGVIMMTTLLSAFTLTMWLDVLRSFGLV